VKVSSQPRALTVSLVTSVLAPRDAISNVCRQQLDAVARHGQRTGRLVDVKLFARQAAVHDSRVALAPDLAALVADPHFNRSDVIVFQFGILNPLFDAVHFAPRTAKVVACFYGITPPGLLPGSQEVLYQSYRQAANLHAADQILTTSGFLAAELSRLGVAPARVVRIALPAGFAEPPDLSLRPPPGDELRLAYLGRFVAAKGVHDLLAAARDLAREGRPLRVDLVGSRTFSDARYLEGLHRFVAEHGLGEAVRFHFDVPDGALTGHLLRADALVIPSLHEGFCVPVVEGLACGCFVICADAGALPETCGGLGATFAAGRPEHLAARLRAFAAARQRGGYPTDGGWLAAAEWRARARAYAADFSPARFGERFCAAVFGDLQEAEYEVHAGLAEARRQALAALTGTQPAPAAPLAMPPRLAEALTAGQAGWHAFAAP
jgi:glycosyltransferase involved in cell wall biosynthesis